ncbi:uncharacterized protein LOC122668752 [Telopea speciosissima]|uniref:uncharacterized protein LOC122668752 n=1 Tax=Telopea speciosissima TaxID=54955 RepID=UPI001CC3E4B1|nr:uncharacterized protein LOC122668752 [Telopea speciosissima]
MKALFIGIKEAKKLKIDKLWVESDSTSVVTAILTSKLPWNFFQNWWTASEFLDTIQWRLTHCFREGNGPTDKLANHAALTKATSTWNATSRFISHLITWEAMGRPHYRFL